MSLEIAKRNTVESTERAEFLHPIPRETPSSQSRGVALFLRARRERTQDRLRRALQSARGETRAFLTVVARSTEMPGRDPLAKPEIAPHWQRIKRAADVVLASVLLLLASPVMLVVALCVGTTGNPILFRQTRVGKDGELFQLVKFRTMLPDAEERLQTLLRSDPAMQEEWSLTQKLQNDPRITRVGQFLRRSSLDELPQLLNVIAGEMSIVGPRPVVPNELERYGVAASWYMAVRPGVTGLWQVSGRNDTSYARRVSLDVHYVRSQKVWLDAFILLKTVYVVLLGKGAH